MRYFALFPVLVVGVVWVFLAPLSRDGDLWMHLASGRAIWEWVAGRQAFPWTDPFSYGMSSANELHSWLGQFLLWAIHRALGELGLRFLHLAILSASLFFMGRWVWRRTGKQMFVVSLVVTLGFLLHREMADLKPALFGELFFCLFVFGLDSEPHRATRSRVALVFILCVLWINLHGSGLMALPLLFAYAFFERAHRDRLAYRYPLAGFVALFLTPQAGAVFYNAVSLSRAATRLGVAEWSARFPFFFVNDGLSVTLNLQAFLYLYLAIAVFLVFRERRHFKMTSNDWFVAGQTLFFTGMATLSWRHSIFLLYPLATLTTYAWNGAQKQWKLPHLRRRIQLFGSIATGALILFCANAMRSEMGVTIPVHAVEFMTAAQLKGNVFNDQVWGGYLAYANYPNLRVALDGRILVHQRTLSRMRESEKQSGMVNLIEILNDLPATDIIVHRSSIPLRELFGKDWVVVFENNVATVLVRKNTENQENLRRVQSYYRSKAIPFNVDRGFDLRAAYGASRTWVYEMEERPDDGDLPLEWIREYRVLSDAQFYLTRRLGFVGVDRLKDALLENVESVRLGVKLGEMLVATGRAKEAQKWMLEMEAMSIPPTELAPIRYALKASTL